MRRALIFFSILFFCVAAHATEKIQQGTPGISKAKVPAGAKVSDGPASVKIIQPNGGENLVNNTDYGIVWNYKGFFDTSTVTLTLVKNGVPVGELAHSVPIRYSMSPSGTGSYKWRVGGPATQRSNLGCGYKVRVTVEPIQQGVPLSQAAKGMTNQDESDGTFCIAAAPPPATLELQEPNGGETWHLGSTQKISWKSSGLVGDVRIMLLQEGYPNGRGIIARAPANSGSYDWKVGTLSPQYPSLSTSGSGFRIQIEGLSAGLTVKSAGSFGILLGIPTVSVKVPTQPIGKNVKEAIVKLSVYSPAAGDKWNRKETHTIEWVQGADRNVPVTISLIHKGGPNSGVPTHRIIASAIANTGSYSWAIPADIEPKDYFIRLTSADGKHVTDSDSFFIRVKTVKKTLWLKPKKIQSSCKEKRWLRGGADCDGLNHPVDGYMCDSVSSEIHSYYCGYDYKGEWLNNWCRAGHACTKDLHLTYDLGAFKPYYIEKATLKWDEANLYCIDNDFKLRLYYLNSPWIPGTITGYKIAELVLTYKDASSYYTGAFDVWTVVDRWRKGEPNFGLLLPSYVREDSRSEKDCVININDLKFVIEYTEEP